MATYAIGDIHGRSNLLTALLQTINPRSSDDVVFLGDYIDRVPDSCGVIDTLLAFEESTDARVAFLLGNHEQWLLRSMRDHTRHSWVLGMQGLSTVRSYSPEVAELMESAIAEAGPAIAFEKPELPYGEVFSAMPANHIEFFQCLRPYTRTQHVVCVHAGVSNEYVRVEDETEAALVWGTDDWWLDYSGPDEIVYGHWGNACSTPDSVSPFIYGRTIGIDCVGCGQLMAIRFPDREFWVVS